MSTATAEMERLYRENFSKVYHYVHSRFPLIPPEEVEDVVQETFLRVCRVPERAQQVEMVVPWLYRIAHNAAVDALRSKHVRLKQETGCPYELAGYDGGYDLQEEYDRLEAIRAVLAGLSEECQRIFILALVEGYSRREIGELLGKSEHAIKMHLHRAYRAFRRHYQGVAP